MLTRWKLILTSFCFAGLTGAAYAHDANNADHNILVIGDSLSAEYGIARGSGWVQIVQTRIDNEKFGYRMQNASVSGDTTSGGLSRTPAALQQYQPAIVIIELGSNDALRGLDLGVSKDNLDRMIRLAQAAGARVLLVGMHIPPNYGRRYSEQFHNMFRELAEQHQLDLVPFLLQDVALNKEMFLDDGLHPNEAAQETIADNVWVVLKPMLESKTGKH